MNVYFREQQLHFAVEEIIDHRYVSDLDCFFFKVKWHQQYQHAPTWEPLANLRCPKLLLTYTLKSESLLDPTANPTGASKTDNVGHYYFMPLHVW